MDRPAPTISEKAELPAPIVALLLDYERASCNFRVPYVSPAALVQFDIANDWRFRAMLYFDCLVEEDVQQPDTGSAAPGGDPEE